MYHFALVIEVFFGRLGLSRLLCNLIQCCHLFRLVLMLADMKLIWSYPLVLVFVLWYINIVDEFNLWL